MWFNSPNLLKIAEAPNKICNSKFFFSLFQSIMILHEHNLLYYLLRHKFFFYFYFSISDNFNNLKLDLFIFNFFPKILFKSVIFKPLPGFFIVKFDNEII